ncbi:hypothetical protein CROQUDRAFT_9116, partial [Cronartium quercuum f. sp. fusiforme G11]
TRPRKRPRENVNENNLSTTYNLKPHSSTTTSLRRTFNQEPTIPILSDKRYGNVIDPILNNLLNIITKQFILSWFTQISPIKENTKVFSTRVNQILIQLIRDIERRLHVINPIDFFLIDLPNLLNSHLIDLKETKERLRYQVKYGIEVNLIFEEMFLRIRNHNGIQLTTINNLNHHHHHHHHSKLLDPLPKFPDIKALPSPTYLRLLIEHLMEIVLPLEDWESESERFIIREIILNVLLVPLFCNLSQPNTIYNIIGNLLENEIMNDDLNLNQLNEFKKPLSIKVKLFSFFNQFIHFLFLLPSIYQSIRKLSSIDSNLINDHSNNFEPFIKLFSLILKSDYKRLHLRSFFWFLSIFFKLFNKLFTRLFVHIFYTYIFNPQTISNILIQITIILENIDNPITIKPKTRQQTQFIINSKLSKSFCNFLNPGLNQKDSISNEFLELFDYQLANLSILFKVLEISLVRVFPELVDWDIDDDSD